MDEKKGAAVFYITFYEGEEGTFSAFLRTVSSQYIVRYDENNEESYGFSNEAAMSLLYYYLKDAESVELVRDIEEMCFEWTEYTASELAKAYMGDERNLLSKMRFAQNAADLVIDVGSGVAAGAITGDVVGMVKDCVQGGAHFITGLVGDWKESKEKEKKAASKVIDMLDASGEYEILYVSGGSYLVRRAETRSEAPIRTTYSHVGQCVHLLVPKWHEDEYLKRFTMLSDEARAIVCQYYNQDPHYAAFIPSVRMLGYLWGEYSPRRTIGELVHDIHAVIYGEEVNYVFQDRKDYWENIIEVEMEEVGSNGSDDERLDYIQGLIDTYGITIGGAVEYIGPLEEEYLVGLENGNVLVCRPYRSLPSDF